MMHTMYIQASKRNDTYIVHILHIYCTYIVHILYIYCTYIVHILYIYCTYIVHILYICCTYIVHMLHICCTYIVHILYICCTYIVHMLYIYCTYIVHIFQYIHTQGVLILTILLESKNFSVLVYFIGTVLAISSDFLCKDGNARFTMVPLKPLSYQ